MSISNLFIKTNQTEIKGILQNLYRQFENFEYFIIVLNEKSKVIYCSENLIELMGWHEKGTNGKSWFDLFEPDSGEHLQLKDIPQNLFPSRIQNVLITKDKKCINVLWKNFLFRNNVGDGKVMICLGEDITQKANAERSSRETETICRTLIENISEGIVVVDRKGKINFVNPVAEMMLGFSHIQLLGKTFAYPYDVNKTTEIDIINKDVEPKKVEIEVKALSRKNNNEFILTLRDITEKKKAEYALTCSEIQFRQVWEKSFDGMRLIDENGVTYLVNEAYCKMCGKTKEELEGQPFSVIYHQERRDEMIKKHSGRFASETIEPHLERELTLWNGKIVWFELSNSYVYLENNRKYLFSILRDSTNYKKALDDLKKYNEKFSFHFNQTPLAYLEFDMKMNIKDWNPAAEKIFGYTKTEILDKSVSILTIGDTFERDSKKWLDEMLLSHKGIFGIQENKTKDGREIICEWYNTPLIDVNNEVIGIASLANDITERKKIEAELSESEKKYKALMSNLPDIVLVHVDDKIVFANESLAKRIEYPMEEILGKSIYDFLDEKYVNSIRANLSDRLKGGSVSDYEIGIKTKSNERVTVVVRSTPITFNNKRAILVVLIDITERKLYETKLKEYASEQKKNKELLEEKARELESLNNKLELSQTQLIELNASKDKLFSIVAHDLRSPFHGLIGLSQILADESSSLTIEEMRKFNSEINKTLKNQFKFLENLLEWSRLQIGRAEFNPVKINLYEKANESVNIQFANALKKDIRIINNIRESLFVKADANMLQSVIQNLLSNAVKFTYSGGEVSLDATEGNDNVKITINDTGTGIKPEDIDKLFRIDKEFSTRGTANEKGTGLGLVLCKEMIEKHGGSIFVESQLGVGSKFIFTLPKIFFVE